MSGIFRDPDAGLVDAPRRNAEIVQADRVVAGQYILPGGFQVPAYFEQSMVHRRILSNRHQLNNPAGAWKV